MRTRADGRGAEDARGNSKFTRRKRERARPSFEGKPPAFLPSFLPSFLSNQLDVPLGACNKEEPAAIHLDERFQSLSFGEMI